MRTRGFTLIELMVVIAIIGLLASIITISLVSSKAKGRDAKRVADVRTIQLALETYYNDNGTYPVTIYNAPFTPNYLTTVPTDPNSQAAYKYSAYNSAGSANCTTNLPIRYHLAAVMESSDTQGSPLPYNSVLKQDNDWSSGGLSACTGSTADFNGNALNCSGGANSYDNCYDVTTN